MNRAMAVSDFAAAPSTVRHKAGGLAAAVEWIIALAATVASIYLHVCDARWAGPLWRDEANTAAVAFRPSWGEIWQALSADNFPLLSTMIVRVWGWTAWGQTDQGLRVLATSVGIAMLGVLWLNAWRIKRAPPTVALALWAFNPVVIHFTDSLRPHSIGLLLQFLATYAFGNLAIRPSWRRFAIASILGVLSVQAVYQNALVLLIFGLAGAAVSLRNKDYRAILMVLAAGAVAAISLLPYLAPLRASRDWAMLMEVGGKQHRYFDNLPSTLAGDQRGILVLVLAVFAAALVAGVIALARHASPDQKSSDWSLFALLVGGGGSIAYGLFLFATLGFPPTSWHFFPILAMLVFACDCLLSGVARFSWARSALVVLVAVLSWSSTLAKLDHRQTNIDLIARYLEENAGPNDLIIVNPWYLGVTFQRYYHGQTPWATIPELADSSVHRYDLVKQSMVTPNVMRPLLERISQTLALYGHVWFVGGVPQQFPMTAATDPAPHPLYGWQLSAYNQMWGAEVANLIHERTATSVQIPIASERPVSTDEIARLQYVSGWKPAADSP